LLGQQLAAQCDSLFNFACLQGASVCFSYNTMHFRVVIDELTCWNMIDVIAHLVVQWMVLQGNMHVCIYFTKLEVILMAIWTI
jgi:hypothetical protein